MAKTTQLHTLYAEAYSLAYHSCVMAEPGEIIFIVGPTGAGKTHICHELRAELVGAPETWTAGSIPLIYEIAMTSDQSYFSSKSMFERILEALGDPFLARSLAAMTAEDIDSKRSPIQRGMTEPRIRIAAERLAIARGLKFLIIDEANLICMTAGSRSPEHHLEGLRVFCMRVGAVLVLAGTVRLMALWNNSGQINRAMRVIHVRRYRQHDANDHAAFLAVVGWLCGQLKVLLSPPTCMERRIELVMEATAGVFGEARSALRRMLAIQAAESAPAINDSIILRALPTRREVERQHAEAVSIEVAFEPFQPKRGSGGKSLPNADEADPNASPNAGHESSAPTRRKKRSRHGPKPRPRARKRVVP